MKNIKVWKIDITSPMGALESVELPKSIKTLNEASSYLPGGAYTTFRTYNGRKVIRLAEQIQRLEESCRTVNQPILIDEKSFREVLRETVDLYPARGELRFRISVDLEHEPGFLFIVLELLQVPSKEEYINGVRVVTCDLQRFEPKAKLTNFISKANRIREQLPDSVHEALMVNTRGFILEGLSSNFFGILNGELWTEEEVVLSGITRGLVIEEALKAGIIVNSIPILISDIPALEGAFITSASRGILPICCIDDIVIVNSAQGDLINKLIKLYNDRIFLEVKPI